MNKLIAAFYLGTLAAWAPPPGIALAGEAMEGEIRVITPTEATSDCIGDPRTPLCAVETVIACDHDIRYEGCKEVGLKYYRPKQVRIEYVIEKMGFVNREKVLKVHKEDEAYEFGNYPWLSIDAFQAKVRERECPLAQPTCEGTPWRDTFYTVSPHKGYWTYSIYGVFTPENWFVD